MTAAVTLEELLAWNEQSSRYWKAHLDANPALLHLPFDVGGTTDVLNFIRHIWVAELRWAQRLAGVPVAASQELPTGPPDALFALHLRAAEIYRHLFTAAEDTWNDSFDIDIDFVPAGERAVSRRRVVAHALLHSQRHWAQLATIIPTDGFPWQFRADLLFKGCNEPAQS
jgi:uncharacterized damage-inducible protein DinB